MALSVLVVIEMLNALNALSEDGSLLQMPPWCNPWLLVAIVVSLGLHCVIMYIPALASLFEITALDCKVGGSQQHWRPRGGGAGVSSSVTFVPC